MLAPLFNRPVVLNTFYPPAVMRYLNEVPAGQEPTAGTRVEQLNSGWVKDGRIEAPGSPKRDAKIAALTASMTPGVRLTISDLQDRQAMLGDVAGRVALINRDMAALMRSYRRSAHCEP